MHPICHPVGRRAIGLLGRALWPTALSLLVLVALPIVASAADYTVQRGDTLSEIAARQGTTTGALARANGIADRDLIYVGQRLRLPGPAPAPAKTPTPAAPTSSVTTVKPGDTLIRIANRLGTTADSLAKANGIQNPDRIYVGQRLVAPDPRASPKSPVAVGAYTIPIAGFREKLPTHWDGSLGAADLMAKKGAPIYSVASGRVVEVSNRGLGGNNVTILGTDNRYYYYAHMNEYPLVSVGATVKSGQRIGSVGDTGNAAGRPHLHLGIGDRITTGNGDSRGGAGVNFNVPAFLNRLIDSAYKR